MTETSPQQPRRSPPRDSDTTTPRDNRTTTPGGETTTPPYGDGAVPLDSTAQLLTRVTTQLSLVSRNGTR